MIVPLAGRAVAAVIGGLLVLTAASSVIGTIIVPRPAGGWLTRSVDWLVNGAFRLAIAPIASYKSRDHTTYLPLVRFRSPRPLSSWVIALLAVLDSAALYLALSPEAAPAVPARLCLRSGFICFTEIARELGLRVPEAPDPGEAISLRYEEFLDAVGRMREVSFPIERDPEQAWPDFVGWRLDYETAAYAVAKAVDAVPALWSGPRRRPYPAIAPIRPAPGRPPK